MNFKFKLNTPQDAKTVAAAAANQPAPMRPTLVEEPLDQPKPSSDKAGKVKKKAAPAAKAKKDARKDPKPVQLPVLATAKVFAEGEKPVVLEYAAVTATSLKIQADLTKEQHGSLVRQIMGMDICSSWWLADALNYGDKKYGDKYIGGLESTAYAYSTLRNFASVAARMEPSRRRDSLRWEHHREIVKLKDVKRQDYWLDRAEKERLTVKQLRELLKEPQDGKAPAKPQKSGGGWLDAVKEYAKWEKAQSGTVVPGDFVKSITEERWPSYRTAFEKCAKVGLAVMTELEKLSKSKADAQT